MTAIFGEGLHSSRCMFAALIALSIVGCNGGERLVDVEGRVTLDGKPLSGAQVMFYPLDTNDRRAFWGRVSDEGRFTLGEKGDESGVPPGKYRVSISTAVTDGPSDELTPTPPERVPAKYKGGALEFEVPEDGTQEADFDLES